VPRDSWILAEHIFRKTQATNFGTDNLPAAIRQVVQVLVTDGIEAPGKSQEGCIRILSKAAALNMGTRTAVAYLPSASEVKDNRRHAWKSTTNNLVAAAACLGDLPFFERLIKERSIDASENLYFGNPLRGATVHGHYELAKFLLDQGIDVNQVSASQGLGETALQMAALYGQKDIIPLILDPKYKCLISRDSYGSAITHAVSGGHIDILRLLIAHTNVDTTKNNILWDAVRKGHEEIVRLALENGADPNMGLACQYPSLSPLAAAAEKGFEKVIKILLEYGASPKVGGSYDPLRISLQRRYRKSVQVLVEHGMDINNPLSSPWPSYKIDGKQLLEAEKIFTGKVRTQT